MCRILAQLHTVQEQNTLLLITRMTNHYHYTLFSLFSIGSEIVICTGIKWCTTGNALALIYKQVPPTDSIPDWNNGHELRMLGHGLYMQWQCTLANTGNLIATPFFGLICTANLQSVVRFHPSYLIIILAMIFCDGWSQSTGRTRERLGLVQCRPESFYED